MTSTTKIKSLPNIPIPEKLIKINPFINDKTPVESNLLSFVSNGLEFDVDVVQKLCPSSISFAHYNSRSLYVPNSDVKHSPRPPHRLQPLPLSLPQERWEHARRVLKQKPIVVEPQKFQPQQSLFYMTEINESDEYIKKSKQQIRHSLTMPTIRSETSEGIDETMMSVRPGHDGIERQAQLIADKDFSQMERNWDEYMFEHLDQNTATFIILKHVHDEERRARLIEYLRKTYHITKLPNPLEMELIPTYDDEDNVAEQSYFKKLTSQTSKKDTSRDLQQQTKEERKDGLSSKVRPAQQIVTGNSFIRQDPTYYDVISDKITDTVYRTDHPYEKAMILGTNAHQPTDEPGVIALSDKIQFNKVLQKQLPPDPDSIASTLEINSSAAFDRPIPTKGLRRWKALPGIRNTHIPRPPDVNDLSLSWLLPLINDSRINHALKLNTTISRIIEEWKRRWQGSSRWRDADIDELYRDLHDRHPHIRFTALVICSRAAQHLTQKEIDLGLQVRTLPDKLLDSIEALLDDSEERIRSAAAIVLVTLRRFSPQVEKILRLCIVNGHPEDKLTAAQSLASVNITTSDIIHELLKNYFDTDYELAREQLIFSLSKLSQGTNLVHSLTGEYLNSADANDRLIACKLFPLLKSQPNKDITQKLIYLMWQDMNSSVRRVAGQALGKCGCGQAVHEEVVTRLQSRYWQDRVEALKLIGYLGVLTAKLIQPFLKCFKDDRVSVRIRACRTTYKLQAREENIRDLLIELIEYDPIEKVRYAAVEALGLYGMTNKKCRNVLLWSVRYDKSPLVRSAAPNSIVLLEKADEEIIDTLQSRYLVEKQPIVIQSLKEALEAYHCNLSQDVPIIQEIRNEVRKLNTKAIIWEKIINFERELRFTADLERLIAPSMDKPPTPFLTENEMQSSTDLTYYIQNVVDINNVPEIWSPELWHPDMKTGKIRKHRLTNEKHSPDLSTTITTEFGQPSYSVPPRNKSCGQEDTDHLVDCSGICMSYLNKDGNAAVFLAIKSKILSKAGNDESSLSCYDCSSHNPECGKDTSTLVHGCQTCMVYRNTFDADNVVRRCCTSGCGSPGTIGEFDGRKTYFCSSNECNRVGAEKVLSNTTKLDSTSTMLSSTVTTTLTTTVTTTSKTSFSCYECSGLNEQPCTTTAPNCPMCMVSRNDDDPTKFDRRCCWWGCGAPNQITEYSGRPTYFCNADNCNGPNSDARFNFASVSASSTTTVASTITTTVPTTSTVSWEPSSSQCYECSGSDCGREGSSMSNCPKCMVYRNPDDQTKIERRCCWWNCGPSNSVSTYNGLETYFCTGDKCNGYGTEYALRPAVTTTTARTTIAMTTTIATTTTTTTPITEPPSSQCYECSGSDCGKEGSPMSSCPKCIVYRNPDDQTKIERRCCWWGCGPSNSVSTYNGVETYFCTGNKCNGYGAEYALRPAVTTSTIMTTTAMTTTTMTTTIARTTMMTTTTTTAVTTEQPSSQCYDCSGSDCGKEGSSMSMHCPKCMVYRNPTDQTIIERRCCWWGCGPSNSVSTYNGIETYFCTGNKCNGYGAEYTLSPPVTTTTVTTMRTSTVTMMTTPTVTMMTTSTRSTSAFSTATTALSSTGSCTLNCQNGGTPEIEDGCFCYCLENTNGRECENVDCRQPDVDSEICSLENQPLCEESETFAFECHHLCGKC
ncbi:unnamed protein product [Adineta steineri]|uniref:Uncharacterized protein n=1 Tax=Adineta steineri TaxID=433720 RepID=A0A814T7Y1_9BILA|nr:unnamed protein product [Adineta steineri]CAF1158336.1 unnamed protein product [Adineta steineri]